MEEDEVSPFLDYQNPDDALVLSELYVYRKSLWGMHTFCILVGVSHFLLFSLLFIYVMQAKGVGLSNLFLNISIYWEAVSVLACLSGQAFLGASLIISRVSFRYAPWPLIQAGYWNMLLVLLSMTLSPCCLVSPIYLFMFLEVRECYLAAHFMVHKGFDLRNLPDY